MKPPETLVELLQARARHQPEDRLYTFLADGEEETATLTYGELDRRARALAVHLSRQGLAGERALLIHRPGLDLIAAFFGCLYAGMVAVPAHPPRQNRNLRRLRALAASARPRAVLTDAAVLARTGPGPESDAAGLGGVPWLATDELAGADPEAWLDPGIGPGTVAFLQYTSGSTAEPKGVVLTHANLLANQRMIERAFAQTAGSTIVGWLPLQHDMGLIGNMLQPLWLGARCVLMPPTAFLQKPLRWLRAISRYRGTTSGGPDFAYDLCARRIAPADREGLDLSSWSLAFNGAEPVRAATLDRFAEAFAPCGFRREAFYPCYGLAEATLFVAGGTTGRPPVVRAFSAPELERHRGLAADGAENVRRLVGCGAPPPEQELAIVDPEVRVRLAPGEVGEIWVRGPGVAAGYWRDEEETERVFRAFLAGGEGPFLRTGDLGFVDGGELFVTGRLKDLIILRGRNVYPQDVERAVEASHPALRAGGAASFAIETEGEERLVVIQEIERGRGKEAGEALAAIARAVAEEVEAQPHEVVLLRAGTLLKTSSGKVQRRACRDAWLRGELDVVARSGTQPAEVSEATGAVGEDVELWLRSQVAALARTGIAAVPPDSSLASAGLDSLGAVELAARAEAALGAVLPLDLLLQGTTLRELAERLAAGTPAPAAPAGGDLPPELPLAPGQRGFWFLQAASPASAAYQIAGAARVVSSFGPFDPDAFARAVRGLADRHPALRTSFPAERGEPRRRIAARGNAEVRIEDATGWSEERVLRRLAEAAFQPFDLAQGPLVRALALPRAEEPAALLLAVHHLVADLWSMAVLVRDLGALYDLEAGLASVPLPPPAVEPAGWAAERERTLAGPEGERLWEYWRERLAGAPAALELPADRPRSSNPGDAGSARRRALDADLAGALRALARQRGATLFAALLAGLEALLFRWSGQEDFVVGVPASGRAAAAARELVGYFVEPLPLRADLSGDPGFAELLERARTEAVGGLAHAGLPLSLLTERLRPERAAGRMPLFEVLFAFQQAPSPGLAAFAAGDPAARIETGSLSLAPLELPERRMQLDLLLMAAESAGGLSLSLEYRTERFEATTIDRLLGSLETLLRAAAAAPGTPVAELPLLAAAERLQVLALGQGGEAPPPVAGLLHEGFFLQAGRTPGAIALIDGEEVLTYGDLAARAGRLAERLRGLGIGPEDRVGVCLERSSWLVASLLGVLAAGGAYVPLAPEYPAERLELLARDADVRMIVTRSALRAPGAFPWLDLDAPDDGRTGVPGPGPFPESLAYLIYTSGSTGTPKGVAIEHRAAALLVAWARRAFSEDELAGVLAATAVSFDLSVFELFAPLSLGGAVILAPDALRLPELPARDRVTLVNTVPSVAAELVESAGWPSSVRTVNLAGEALTGALARRVHLRPGVNRVLNLYGPSEDTTYSTEAAVAGQGGEPTIGLPLPGKRAYVVDRNLEPLPPGVPGELLLGGGGLARGYFGRPGLTAERFVPDPFAAEPGGRLYRTGDLARRRADGELEFLGRLDRQVKLRGYRVEPGEIEAALAEQPGVREAAVLPRSGRLIAWVAGPEPGEGPRLREALSRRLPAHLVPAAFVLLPSLPRTAHGKVDRKALPDPLPAAGPTIAESAGTPEEEVLASIFARLLGLGAVGPEDSFFDLGGHSLLAMRLLFEAREAFGRDLTVADVFENPAPAALARRVRALQPAGAAPPIERLPRGGDLPVSFGQRRLWLLDRLRPGLAAYNVPGLLRLAGPLDGRALAVSLARVLARHEALRTVFVEAGEEPVQRIASVPAEPLPVVDLAALGEEGAAAEADRIALGEARLPFDLARGALYRFRLLRVGPEESRLVAVLHHAVCDGGSLEVLLAELAAGYRSEPLPALPVQYADFAAWQRRRLGGEALERELEAWRRRLEGAPPAAELPCDRPRPAVSAFRGALRSLPLPPGADEAAAALARRGSATLFMALAAVAFALLRRVTGEEDLVLGTPVAGRPRPELAGLIGFFVNTLPLRCELPGDPAFAELLDAVRRSALDAWSRQDVPFERLVEELRPARDLGRSPIFQVMLLLERPLPAPELPGLAAEVRELHNGSAKFDLTFAVRRQDGQLNLACEYDEELFDAATAGRLLERFGRLLLGAAAEPGRRLSELPLLAETERAQLLDGWQGGPAPRPASGLVHERVLAQAARTPGAIALIGGGERWTYARLAGRVEEIAARLRCLGAGPERIVGVCLDRTPELVAALLAVLRAGAAYLPLDPAYPRERLAWMLEDAAACAVLTREELAERLPERGAPRVILEELAALPAAASGWRGWPGPEPGNLAYLIYTSGSTGRPKAVAIEHRSAAALVEWARGAFAPEELAGVLAATSVTFDLSVFEMFVPLSLGGAAVVAENALALPGPEVTLVNTVPSVLAELLHRGSLPPGVVAVNLAGEALPRELVRRLQAAAPAVVVRNLYGPSEDTTYSTWTVISPIIAPGAGAPAIGRPLPGTRALVLDRWLSLAPPGSAGELCLGGEGLARGYLGRPDLTAERFVPDPFGGPGERLYRTGDLVRHRPDGELEYLGRADHQIKVRGFRVEPGEVEAALEAHPAVRRAAVLARGDAAGRHLVAFVTPEGPVDTAELRAFLRRSLPEPLVPSELIPLPSLPLTAHGKVDRRALSAIAGEARDGAFSAAPRTSLEETIAAAFAELLEHERVGIHDDFFTLGGHSLLAHRLVGRLRDTFGVELPLRTIFESPTVAGMAVEIARALLADAGEEMAAAALAEMEPR